MGRMKNGTLTRRALLGAFAALVGAAGSLWPDPAPAAPRKTVVATISQIAEPLAVIAAGRADIRALMGEGVDPHLYRLTRADVAKLARADLILFNGLHLEAQMLGMMKRFAAEKPVVALGDALAADRLLPWSGGGTEATRDPHIWMDPALWAQALGVAVDALAKLDPANAAVYRTNAEAYFAKLAELDARARAAVATIPESGRGLVTAHDAFGYFGRSYGLEVLPVQGISTESEAGIRHIEALVDTLVRRRIGAVFVETSVSERNVRALIEGAAARGHRVSVGGSLFSDAMGARGTYTGTYPGMFDHNVTTIVRALGGKVPKTGLAGQLAERRD
jgi:manganese/zinc/iron transport system substrate-binding protein